MASSSSYFCKVLVDDSIHEKVIKDIIGMCFGHQRRSVKCKFTPIKAMVHKAKGCLIPSRVGGSPGCYTGGGGGGGGRPLKLCQHVPSG